MDGKELWKLLDLVNSLNNEADDFEKAIKEATTEPAEAQLQLKASIYRQIARRLRELLRNLNEY